MTSNNPFADRLRTAAKEGYVTGTRREYRQPSFAADLPLLTDKQRNLIESLLSERDLAAETRPKFRARVAKLAADHREVAELDREKASNLITYLFGLPQAFGTVGVPAAFDAVPAGRYALDRDGEVTFYKVDRPTEGKWAGKVFVSLQHGSDYTSMSRQAGNTILGHIVDQGVQEAMLRYGRELGHCGAPNCGLPLTNAESRELGIGPVCRTKMGW